MTLGGLQSRRVGGTQHRLVARLSDVDADDYGWEGGNF
jgi:hypothetical protein